MKIAFVDYVCDPAQPGHSGLSDLVWDMAGRLSDLGDEVHVVGPYTTNVFPNKTVHVHTFRIPPIGYRNTIGHFWIILRAYKELRKMEGIEIIHTPEYTSGAFIASLFPVHLVFTEPGNIFERLENGNPYDWSTTQVYKLAARRISRKAAHLIATSELMKMWWHRTGMPLEKITIIPLGVDTSLFRPASRAREKLGIADTELTLLYAARLSRENGLDVTLKAISILSREFPNLRLHILGSGPESEKLTHLAEQLGIQNKLTWHGWIDLKELPLYYSAADIFVFSGFSGGTPRVMLQAMACGAPVVASEIGGIVDHIQEGESGLLFPAGDAETMAEKVKSLLSSKELRSKIGQAGQQYVRNNVDWNILIKKIRLVYDSLTKNGTEK